MVNKKKKIVVMVSGGFDPLHFGHVRLFNAAKKLGDVLVVVVNNDNWLRKKKGFVFMSQKERKEVLLALRSVDKVVFSKHGKNLKSSKDMSVSRDIKAIRPDIFANGGDRNKVDAANPKSSLYWDTKTCGEIGCKIVYNVGLGGKIQSSSWLLAKYKNNKDGRYRGD